MSPGTTWQPFEISSAEYEELVDVIRELDPKSLGDQARCLRLYREAVQGGSLVAGDDACAGNIAFSKS